MKNVLIAICLFSCLCATAQSRRQADKPPLLDVLEQGATPQEYVVMPAPAVAADSVLAAIVAQYKGKVVLMDFWYSGCGPCIAGMVALRPYAKQMKENGVVKVYITAEEMSPKMVRDQMVPLIGGMHYVLDSSAQVEAIMTKYGPFIFPTYFIFDRNGKKVWQQTDAKNIAANVMGELAKVW